VKHRLIACESFLRASDFSRATRRADDVDAILAREERHATPLSEVFRRFRAKWADRRRFRRLYLGAEAVARFVTSGAATTFVIPDERQPLARASAAAAKAHPPARVVSVPEPTDQFVRPMPYWPDVVSDAVVVSCSAVQSAVTRSGIPDLKVRACAFPGHQRLLDAVADPPGISESREVREPVILFCDQALLGGRERFIDLANCLGSPPAARLIYRPHPVQSAHLLRLMVKGGTVERSDSIVLAIRSADVVVTHSSMVAAIAVLLTRPVIVWSGSASPTMPVLLLAKVAYWARTRDHLATLVTMCLRSRPDHPLREYQRTFKRELASMHSEGRLDAVLNDVAR
jgi:hypothetical protein